MMFMTLLVYSAIGGTKRKKEQIDSALQEEITAQHKGKTLQ